MNIFNSLGSNYDLRYVLHAISSRKRGNKEKLEKLLEKRYGGKVTLLYKGREALSLAIQTLNLQEGSKIAINGFTCVAVFNAIRAIGFEPVCVDLEKNEGLNFTPDTLEQAIKKDKDIRVVVIQNTLGYPCEVENIKILCSKYNLVLIEDLAHCIGAKYQNGREAGSVGDMVCLSFSQDKIIDAVSGGALIIRNPRYKLDTLNINLKKKSFRKDRLYPHLTYKIRFFYNFGLGKPYHFLIKRLGLLSNIMDRSLYNYYALPPWHTGIALYMFGRLEEQLEHRRKIANIYLSKLPEKLLFYDKPNTLEAIKRSSNLRFPILSNNRVKLLKVLQKSGVYLSDIWYVDVASECKNAVYISKQIINLPTHINISEKDAEKICGIIKKNV